MSHSNEKNDVRQEVLEAAERIKKHIRKTPLEYSHYLSELSDCNVYLKLENIQLSGSFKVRGAFNKILSLSREEINKGIVIGSSGNHGIAFAYIFQKFNIPGTIYFPANGSKAKLETLLLYKANVKFHGTDTAVTETYAHQVANETGQLFISPYDDLKIIGGQGTIGVELEKQVNKIDCILVPVGGGGLISGIGGYLKSVLNDVEVIGCQPENSPVMAESIKAGKLIEMESKPSLSDGTVGGIEAGSITFGLCQRYVDDFILVSEEEISKSIRLCLEKHAMLIEGAGALSIASFIKAKNRFKGKNIVLVVSGSGSILEKLKGIIL
ncbi:MAG TPA: threonine/serine dehydratase [Patescibacteria group bacterium]|nr:threonine/serine dehydratase [Patescibacteria group bacterium]